MSQPQAYERVTDFSERDGDDTDHPALNQEFDAAAQSINQVRANLALIQRDDGALKNGSVTADSLAPSAFDAVLMNVNDAVGLAQDASTSALISATTANAARDQAASSSSAAQTSQSAAALNAGTASAAASTASTKAGEAVASASAASLSATTTSTKASEAATSASTATTKASEASASGATATTKAGEASSSAGTASTKAGEAFTSASTASTKASEATASAGTASTKAGEASASAANAASVLANSVQRTSSTGSMQVPAGPTSQRDNPPPGYGSQRANSTLNQQEWWNGNAWVAMGGGAMGGGTDAAVYENDLIATANYTVGQSAMVSGATISIATPAVITLANNFIATQPVRFTTTGALPTGLSEDGAYFVSSAGLSATSFQVAATAAAAKAGTGSIATSGTQSGIHSAGKIKNALTGGPYTIADGVNFKIPTGATWTIT